MGNKAIENDRRLDIPCPFCGYHETGIVYSTVSSILCGNCGTEVHFPKHWRSWDDLIEAYSKRTDVCGNEACPFCGEQLENDFTGTYDRKCHCCDASITFSRR